MEYSNLSFIIFLFFLFITFGIAYLSRRISRQNPHYASEADQGLDGRNLNRWLLGLSAGATSNSGFVVTGAVGLGYTYGLQWVTLPLAWLLGDLVFWHFFPQRLNQQGRNQGLVTLAQTLKSDLPKFWSISIGVLTALILLVGIGAYTSTQWLAGQKFLHGAFGVSPQFAIMMFAVLIIAYSALGGFRGSVYVDTFQAILRLVGTLFILGMCCIEIIKHGSFFAELMVLEPEFFSIFPVVGAWSILAFVLGWAGAAVGFSLSQPQLLSRYYAASSPKEAQGAQWIYIGYVQFTWISMTLFGMALRVLMPNIADPETGLSVFIQNYAHAIIAGIILADIFGVIASTANSLLVSMAQSIRYDFFQPLNKPFLIKIPLSFFVVVLGAITLLVANAFEASVAFLIIKSTLLMSAGLASPMIIKVLQLKHTGCSLFFSLLGGMTSAIGWSLYGPTDVMNEVIVGVFTGYFLNIITYRLELALRQTSPQVPWDVS